MRTTVLRKVIVYGLVLCFVLAVGFLACVRHAIVSGLDEYIAMAQSAHPYPDDNIAALIDFVDSDEHGLRDRNRAVWVLGRLRADRALGVLEKLYTGGECDHAGALCQYELAKAIDMCKNNPPRHTFRNKSLRRSGATASL